MTELLQITFTPKPPPTLPLHHLPKTPIKSLRGPALRPGGGDTGTFDWAAHLVSQRRTEHAHQLPLGRQPPHLLPSDPPQPLQVEQDDALGEQGDSGRSPGVSARGTGGDRRSLPVLKPRPSAGQGLWFFHRFPRYQSLWFSTRPITCLSVSGNQKIP